MTCNKLCMYSVYVHVSIKFLIKFLIKFWSVVTFLNVVFILFLQICSMRAQCRRRKFQFAETNSYFYSLLFLPFVYLNYSTEKKSWDFQDDVV